MSAPRSDGGPAFPYAFEHDGHADISGFAPGMSLRDYFGAHALAGIVLSPLGQGGRVTYDDTARDAYRYADAMLAARGGKEDAT